jgi:hypothetical protein
MHACMQGNCSAVAPPSLNLPANHVPLRPFLPGQCLLLIDADLLVVERKRQLWLDRLYMRITDPRDGLPFDSFIRVDYSGAELWVTGVTMQGNGDGIRDCWGCAMGAFREGRVYAEGTQSLAAA